MVVGILWDMCSLFWQVNMLAPVVKALFHLPLAHARPQRVAELELQCLPRTSSYELRVTGYFIPTP